MTGESLHITEVTVEGTRAHYLVNKKALREGVEYKPFQIAHDNDSIDLSVYVRSRNYKERLGLHWGIDGGIRPSHFVGAVWLDPKESVSLVVRPKIKTVDAVDMYTRVASHSYLFRNLGSVFECYPDQPPISGEPLENLSLLQVAVYLKRLAEFCRKDLRLGFIRKNDNLVGKAKGKILVGENLRKNIFYGRLDRVFCQYQLFSVDTLENQILKLALWICLKVLTKSPRSNTISTLWQWAKQCDSALAHVSLRHIDIADFRGVVYSGLMIRYKEPHNLAKMIIRRFRVDAEGKVTENKTVPFYLDMNTLFEMYVGVKLKNMGLEITGKDYQKEKHIPATGFELKIRPDYVYGSPDNIAIIDAKYKDIVERQTYENLAGNQIVYYDEKREIKIIVINSDIYQVIAYANLLAHEKSSWSKDVVLAIPVSNNDRIRQFVTWEEFRKDENNPHFMLKLPGNNQIRLALFLCPLPVKSW